MPRFKAPVVEEPAVPQLVSPCPPAYVQPGGGNDDLPGVVAWRRLVEGGGFGRRQPAGPPPPPADPARQDYGFASLERLMKRPAGSR
jgi:hypothetical protein